jgi:hypothetical protein
MRQRLGDLLNRVAFRHDQFVIERKGKPLAMGPVEQLEQMQEAARVHLLATLGEQSEETPQSQADYLGNDAKHRTRRPNKMKCLILHHTYLIAALEGESDPPRT